MIRKALYVSLSIYLYISQVPPSIAAKIATSWRWKMSTLASTSRISILSHSLVLCSLMEGHSIMRCTGVYRYCWSHLPQTAGWLEIAKRPSHPMPYSTINSNISNQTETNFCRNTFAKVREIFCRKHHITTVINSWRQTDSFRGNSFWWFYAVMALELLVCFSPFQHNRTHAAETDAGSGEMILILAIWPTRPWFPIALKLLVETPRILPADALTLPQDLSLRHPLRSMRLAVMRLSGNRSKQRDYQMTLLTSSSPPGEPVLIDNTRRISRNGLTFVTRNRLVCFHHL